MWLGNYSMTSGQITDDTGINLTSAHKMEGTEQGDEAASKEDTVRCLKLFARCWQKSTGCLILEDFPFL